MMGFLFEGTPITLKGDRSLSRSNWKDRGEILVELNRLEVPLVALSIEETQTRNVLSFLEGLLEEFSGVFHVPTSLSPCRGHEHHIILRKEQTQLVFDHIFTHTFRRKK